MVLQQHGDLFRNRAAHLEMAKSWARRNPEIMNQRVQVGISEEHGLCWWSPSKDVIVCGEVKRVIFDDYMRLPAADAEEK